TYVRPCGSVTSRRILIRPPAASSGGTTSKCSSPSTAGSPSKKGTQVGSCRPSMGPHEAVKVDPSSAATHPEMGYGSPAVATALGSGCRNAAGAPESGSLGSTSRITPNRYDHRLFSGSQV